MEAARQLRQLASFVVTGEEKNRRAEICCNIKHHEAPDQTDLLKCRVARVTQRNIYRFVQKKAARLSLRLTHDVLRAKNVYSAATATPIDENKWRDTEPTHAACEHHYCALLGVA